MAAGREGERKKRGSQASRLGQKEELSFPAKKLKAFWFSPPSISNAADDGDGVNGPLPRVFISQILVD